MAAGAGSAHRALNVFDPRQTANRQRTHHQRNPEHRVVVPDLGNDTGHRARDNPAHAGGISIKGGGGTCLPRHQILEVEHANPRQDADIHGVQQL